MCRRGLSLPFSSKSKSIDSTIKRMVKNNGLSLRDRPWIRGVSKFDDWWERDEDVDEDATNVGAKGIFTKQN